MKENLLCMMLEKAIVVSHGTAVRFVAIKCIGVLNALNIVAAFNHSDAQIAKH